MRKLAFTANKYGRQGRQAGAGQAWDAGHARQAGHAGQAARAPPALFSTISLVDSSKGTRKCTQRHPHKNFQKPAEMSRCSRIRKRIKMLKPLNTNGYGFWRVPNTKSYDWLGYTLHTFKMCPDGVSQERPGVPVGICLESTHTRRRHGDARHVGFCHNSIGVADCLGPWIRRFTKWPGDGAPER